MKMLLDFLAFAAGMTGVVVCIYVMGALVHG